MVPQGETSRVEKEGAMAITSVQFRRACGWCDKLFEAEEDRLTVTIGRRGEPPRTFDAHPACFAASLSPTARTFWDNLPR